MSDSYLSTLLLLLGMDDRALIRGYMLEDYGEVLDYEDVPFS